MTKQTNTSPIIRDIKQIERYTVQNATQDMQFRTFVLRDLPLSNTLLDERVREETQSVWRQIDCLSCGRCCRTLQVVVDDADIARLARHVMSSPRQFQAKYVRVASDGTKHLASIPCPFLQPDNRCSVYDLRPKSCRDFPYLNEANFRSRMLFLLDYLSLCPIVFNVWDRLKRQFSVRRPIKGSTQKRPPKP